jgi:hypothetical protein
MKTSYQPKNLNVKNSFSTCLKGSKKYFFSFIFVNFPANMSYTPILGLKGIHTIFNMWGLKISNNNFYFFLSLLNLVFMKEFYF